MKIEGRTLNIIKNTIGIGFGITIGSMIGAIGTLVGVCQIPRAITFFTLLIGNSLIIGAFSYVVYYGFRTRYKELKSGAEYKSKN